VTFYEIIKPKCCIKSAAKIPPHPSFPKRGITISPFGKGGIRGILRIVGVVLGNDCIKRMGNRIQEFQHEKEERAFGAWLVLH
jgi:hypothetical protein